MSDKGIAAAVKAEATLTVGDKLDRIGDLLANQASSGISPNSRTISITGNPAGTVMVTCGGPNGGEFWVVRRVTLAPPIGLTISAVGTFYLAKGTTLTGGAVIMDIAPTVPNAATYSSDQVMIRFPDDLILVWINGGGTLNADIEISQRQIDKGVIATA